MLHAFRDHPQVTHAFIIDHALRDESEKEVQAAVQYARTLGYQVQIDRWAHLGITSAIQAKARQYRYDALGRMCRDAGLSHLITAHTEDDQAETLLMRLDRQTGWRGLAGMTAVAYAPIWPALAGVTLLRPWLEVSRAELRAYNYTNGLSFVDDPSNENRVYARVRARQALAADKALRSDLLTQQKTSRQRLLLEREAHAEWISRHAKISPHGFIETDAIPPPELLQMLLNVVAGQGDPIEAAKRKRLCKDMADPEFKASTLAGAWIVRTSYGFVMARNRVVVTGRDGQDHLGSVTIQAGETGLWDGRFWVKTHRADVKIRPAFGHLQKLRHLSEIKAIFDLPPEVRPTIPLYINEDDVIIGIGACDTTEIQARATAAQRLQALYSC